MNRLFAQAPLRVAGQRSRRSAEKPLERSGEFARLGVALSPILLERAEDHLFEPVRPSQSRFRRGEPRRRMHEMFDDVAVRRLAHERRNAEEHLVKDDAETIEVGAIVDVLPRGEIAQLLGRHVLRIADHHAGLRRVGHRVDVLGDAKVDDLGDQAIVGVI